MCDSLWHVSYGCSCVMYMLYRHVCITRALCIMCHVSCIMFQVACNTKHDSCAIVMCHVSCVMCHVPCITCHVSCIISCMRRRLATSLVSPTHPGTFNQALMELGALVCTTHTPACVTCPIQHVCDAYADVKRNTRVRAAASYGTDAATATSASASTATSHMRCLLLFLCLPLAP